MSDSIPVHFQNTYQKNIELALQQKVSKLEACVRTESQSGELDFYHSIGTTEAQPIVERHGDTKYANVEHKRRAVTMSAMNWAELIDQLDKVALVTDPTSVYTQAAVAALNRAKDRAILSAALGNAWSGKDGRAVIPFPVATNVVANTFVESGAAAASGLTIAKLRRAKALIGLAENDDDEEAFFVVTENQVQDLLRTTEVTNADYNTVKALVAGSVDAFMGFKFVKLSPGLVPKTGTTRQCVAWKKSGLVLATGKTISTKLSELPTKNYSTQVYAEMMIGAARLDEGKVFRVDAEEA